MPFNPFQKSKKIQAIFVTVSKENSNVIISVKDNGIGISEENKLYFLNQNLLPKQAEWV